MGRQRLAGASLISDDDRRSFGECTRDEATNPTNYRRIERDGCSHQRQPHVAHQNSQSDRTKDWEHQNELDEQRSATKPSPHLCH